MSIGMGYMAAGLNQGLEQKRQRERQQTQDQMVQERHGLQMDQAQQGLQQANELHPLRMEQAQTGLQASQQRMTQGAESHQMAMDMHQQQQSEAQQQKALNAALMRLEVGNDPSELFAFGEQLGVITEPPKQVEGGWEINGQVYPKEDLMGLGAALMQPGALTQMRQQREQQQAQAEQERAGVLQEQARHNQVTLEDGSIGVLVPNTETGGFQVQRVADSQTGQGARVGGADGGPKTADFNSAQSFTRTLYGFDSQNFRPDPELSHRASQAGRIASKAVEKGMNPTEAAYFGYQTIEGAMDYESAVRLAEREVEKRSILGNEAAGELWSRATGDQTRKQAIEERARAIFEESRTALNHAIELGIVPEDMQGQLGVVRQGNDHGAGSAAGSYGVASTPTGQMGPTDEELLQMYGGS